MNRGARIAAGAILVVIGIAALLHFTVGAEKNTYYAHRIPLDEPLREIRIDSESLDLDINFVASASGGNAVRIEGRAEPGVVRQIKSAAVGDGVLHLRFKEPERWKWYFFTLKAMNGKQTVTVELTEEALAALESFRASVGSGSLQVNGASARESVIASDSGGIRIGSLKSGIASVRSGSGSIRLERFEGGSLSLRSDSGGIKAGTVRANLQAKSDSGSITVDHLTGTGEVKTDSGSIRIVKDDGTGMNVSSDSGSVRITVPDSYAGSYDLASDSGSIHHPDPVGTSGELIKVRTDSGNIRIERQA
jgi:hypothetical protein